MAFFDAASRIISRIIHCRYLVPLFKMDRRFFEVVYHSVFNCKISMHKMSQLNIICQKVLLETKPRKPQNIDIGYSI